MNEVNPINTGITQVSPIETKPVSKGSAFLSKISEKIPQKVKDIFNRFYANKKIFWPITILFGIMFLIIILGLLFGSPNAPTVLTPKKTPQPATQATPEASPSGDALSIIENQLKELGSRINSLDTAQSKLKPPAINYNVSF